jgi:hypothetical protein
MAFSWGIGRGVMQISKIHAVGKRRGGKKIAGVLLQARPKV